MFYREYSDNWFTVKVVIDERKLIERFIKILREELRLLNGDRRKVDISH